MNRVLNRVSRSISFGPFNLTTQRRWRRSPIISEQARLEARSDDPKLYLKHCTKTPKTSARIRLDARPKTPKLDELTRKLRRLKLILSLHRLISAYPGQYISLNQLATRGSRAGFDKRVHRPGRFPLKYPRIFEMFMEPGRRKNPCIRFTAKFIDLLKFEDDLLGSDENEKVNVVKIKRLLHMSVNGSVHLHSIRLIRSELGLPKDFEESIIKKYDKEFTLADSEIVVLVDGAERSAEVFEAQVERWRERELEEKWLGAFDVKYAFPLSYPEGFKGGPGFKEKLRYWQALAYIKVYRQKRAVKGYTWGSVARYEKRAVAIIHEILWLTVEKRMEVERLSHFRNDLGFMVNIRELLLKHPLIFYISTKGNNQMLFLREAYRKGRLIDPNPILYVRRKMLNLVKLGARRLQKEEPKEETKDETSNNICQRDPANPDFVLQILDNDANDRI